jgi:ABC-type phosphate/phosphonate transport system substrate-binding protein
MKMNEKQQKQKTIWKTVNETLVEQLGRDVRRSVISKANNQNKMQGTKKRNATKGNKMKMQKENI